MDVFKPEPPLLFPFETEKNLAEIFTQKPARIPLELPLQPTVIIERQEANVLPTVAIVSIFAFFGFLAFLAFMKGARAEKPEIEELKREISEIRREITYRR